MHTVCFVKKRHVLGVVMDLHCAAWKLLDIPHKVCMFCAERHQYSGCKLQGTSSATQVLHECPVSKLQTLKPVLGVALGLQIPTSARHALHGCPVPKS